jgi:thiaminase (transcriptional activator TenA)
MPFSRKPGNATRILTSRSARLPFNEELAAGTLSEACFRHYIVQDAHYLVAFGRALAIAAGKADTPRRSCSFPRPPAPWWSRSGRCTRISSRFGIAPEDFEATPLTPVCHHYNSFLIATAHAEPYPVALAAILPCFWVYAEIGKDIHARAATPNPYQAWIDSYASEEFDEAVRGVIATTDRVRGAVERDNASRPCTRPSPRDAAGMDVLGFRLSAGRVAGMSECG